MDSWAPPTRRRDVPAQARNAGARALLAIFTVTIVGDSGTGSLRDAIDQANKATGTDTIRFNIAGTAVHTIQPLTPLPDITDPVFIDGYSQTGASVNALATGDNAVLKIALNGGVGGAATPVGLHITAGGSTIRGLAIGEFGDLKGVGAGILLDTNGGDVIAGNFIGTDPTGTSARGNTAFGVEVTSAGNTIGGATPAARNVISGNGPTAASNTNFDGIGVYLNGATNTSGGNVVAGNYLGTDAGGNQALSNTRAGVRIDGGANNTIGGTLAGAGNLISGNYSGVIADSQGDVILGNDIGTNAAGTAAAGRRLRQGGRGRDQLRRHRRRHDPRGPQPHLGQFGRRNRRDVRLRARSSRATTSGPTSRGACPSCNQTGVSIGRSSGVTVGGTVAGAGNVINNGIQIEFQEDGLPGNLVEGNLIGTDSTGMKALADGQFGGNTGISLDGTLENNVPSYCSGNTIGGTTAAARNVISGNAVEIEFDSYAIDNLVVGNEIGTDITGAGPLPNDDDGVDIEDNFASGQGIPETSGNTIGGTTAGAGNIIGYNDGAGVKVSGLGTAVTGNAILGNSIASNSGLGIDLVGQSGVDSNDPGDADTGPNLLQNYPFLDSSAYAGGKTTVQGSLGSAPNTTYRIEFFLNSSPDPSGCGQGETYIGYATATTDSSGRASFSFSMSTPDSTGEYLSATATDPAGNTSEFSSDLAVGTTAANMADLSVTVTKDRNPVMVSQDLTYTITVKNLGPGPDTGVSLDDTLPPGLFYVPTESFNSQGSLSDEGGGVIRAPLGNLPSGGTATVTIVGRPNHVSIGTITNVVDVAGALPDPDLTNNSASISDTVVPLSVIEFSEPAYTILESGGTATITVLREGTTAGTATVHYATGGGSATAGSDYQSVSGTLTFGPGVSSASFGVPILDAHLAGQNKTIDLALTNAMGGPSLAPPSSAVLTIVNDNGTKFVVINTNDSGAGSRRPAIRDANASLRPGSDHLRHPGQRRPEDPAEHPSPDHRRLGEHRRLHPARGEPEQPGRRREREAPHPDRREPRGRVWTRVRGQRRRPARSAG